MRLVTYKVSLMILRFRYMIFILTMCLTYSLNAQVADSLVSPSVDSLSNDTPIDSITPLQESPDSMEVDNATIESEPSVEEINSNSFSNEFVEDEETPNDEFLFKPQLSLGTGMLTSEVWGSIVWISSMVKDYYNFKINKSIERLFRFRFLCSFWSNKCK